MSQNSDFGIHNQYSLTDCSAFKNMVSHPREINIKLHFCAIHL